MENPHQASRKLTVRILAGMALGLILGLTMYAVFGKAQGEDPSAVHRYLTFGLFDVVGGMFVNALQMLVVPVVFTSLVSGTAALDDIRKLGRVGVKTLAFYLGTTAVAISLALAAALVVRPGAGVQPGEETFEPKPGKALADVFKAIVPDNPVAALAEGNMLAIIVFAILFGITCTLAGEAGKRVLAFLDDVYAVVMKLVWIVMLAAPVGVFALISKTMATMGWDALESLGWYFGLVIVVLLVHGLVTYPTLLTLLARVSPAPFLRKMFSAQVFAFSTASSNATIPINLRTVRERLGVDRSVSGFTIPFGATINMDGTAIMQGVATVFIAQVYGLEANLGLTGLLMVVLTATLASIGTAGVPSAGLIMLTIVLEQVGLPIEGIAMILGIDRLLDMLRTAVNITGDAAVTTIVAKSEEGLDERVYNDPEAG